MTKSNVVIGAFASAMLMAIGPVAKAAPLDQTCSARLNVVVDEWHAISFPPPEKPGVAVVVGRDHHEATGGQVTYIENLIRAAVQSCRDGNNLLATQEADQAHAAIAATSRNAFHG